jgi:DNA-binding transcriptional MocR family regulator
MASRPAFLGPGIDIDGGAAGLATAIRLSIVDGRIPVGARFPSERALSSQLGVSRGTVVRALSSLRDDGWVTTRHGSGSYAALPASVTSREAPWSVAALNRDGITDLTRAVTSAPHDAYLAAVDRARSSLPRMLIGSGLSDQGLPELRELIASRYTADGAPTSPSQIIITSGARAGLELVLQSVHDARRRIAVETPTFPGALDLLRRSSRHLVAIPVVDGQWTAGHEVLRSANADLAYLTPDFHNPTGSLMADDARRRFAHLAEAHGVTLCVDETQRELNLSGEPVPPPLHGRAVVNLGSLSKSFWGGSRIGWIRCAAPLARRIQGDPHFSLLTPSPVDQLVAHELLTDGDDAMRQRVRHLREQRDLLLATLTGGDAITCDTPVGGLSLWCRLHRETGAAFCARAARAGLAMEPGSIFSVDRAHAQFIRIPFTAPPAELSIIADRLGELLSASPALPLSDTS